MAKMIDAEELWLAVRDDPNITGKQFVAIKEHILGVKTVDAVEVVRCKDCEYAMDMMPIENGGGCLMGECTLRKEDDIVFTVCGDDFCSLGEREGNG